MSAHMILNPSSVRAGRGHIVSNGQIGSVVDLPKEKEKEKEEELVADRRPQIGCDALNGLRSDAAHRQQVARVGKYRSRWTAL